MRTALDKAWDDPNSTKAKILHTARRVFANYGFHGTTTRMIAEEANVDISTLHYHWGDKRDLYEAIIACVNREYRQIHRDVEKVVKGTTLYNRLNVSIEMLTDFLFNNADISSLYLQSCLNKLRKESGVTSSITETAKDIARAMHLNEDQGVVSSFSMLKVLSLMNSIHIYISGEEYFCSILNIKREEYILQVKELLRLMYLPLFTEDTPKSKKKKK